MKNSSIMLFVGVLFFTSLIFFKRYYGSTDRKQATKNQKVSEKPMITPIAKKTTPLQTASLSDNSVAMETTVLEVKPSIYIQATEVADYEEAKKHQTKDFNISKSNSLVPLCKIQKKVPMHHRLDDGIKRLAIIMDDIGNTRQASHLKVLRLPITPSIFPATSDHPNTPQIAKDFHHYMVHCPMEAFHFARPEKGTLKVKDSLEKIKERVATIYQDFPEAIAFNNHTGSKFTSDPGAMQKLFCALSSYKIHFVDSRTAPRTYGKEMGKVYHTKVFCRDIFLDNKPDVGYIRSQLEKAIKIAKKRGWAIAICHPRKETFKALKGIKPLLHGVKLVYMDQLY